MKNTLSSNYLLNRYSYFIYFAFCAFFVVRMKLNGWIPIAEDVKSFCVLTLFFFLWNFVFSGFHFGEQAKVLRSSYDSLRFVKGMKSREVSKSDISRICVHRIHAITPGGRRWYRILVTTKDNERYRFTYISKIQASSLNELENFLRVSENFWGLGAENVRYK